jgi:hypothetical protein
METRDRRLNLALLAAAAASWLVVVAIMLTLDPTTNTLFGYVGALAIGGAAGLTTAPLFWLAMFARHRRIAYRGDWVRAGRRGTWVALLVAVFVVLRVEHIFQPAIILFVVALVVVAETTLSLER